MSILQQDQIDKLIQRIKELIAVADDLFQRYDPSAVATHNTSETSHVDIRRALRDLQDQITASGEAGKDYVDEQVRLINQALDELQNDINDFVSGSVTVKNAENAQSAVNAGFATKAGSNTNGHALADTMIKNVTIDNNGTLTITKIDGGTYTVAIKLATTTTDGLMSKADKVKMDALVTTDATQSAKGYMSAADKKKVDAVVLAEATQSAKGYMSAADKKKLDAVVLTEATTSAKGYMSAADKKKVNDTVLTEATTSAKGYMSAADKTKLDKYDGKFVTDDEVTQMADAVWGAIIGKYDSCWNTSKWVIRVNTWCLDNKIPDNTAGSGNPYG